MLGSSIQVLPREAKYQCGDTIHGLAGASVNRKFKVYGANTGGFSVVYTVLDDDTLVPYCLKAPRGKLTDSDMEQIAREARAWITVGRHPNIVYADSLLEINGGINILLEYVPGQTLSSRMKQSRLTIEEVLNYAIQLCRGIHFAQTKVPGLVHGDIKPGNCLLTSEGTLKVTDFGQVRSVTSPTDDASWTDLTEKSAKLPKHWAAGTPAYMAPEQFDASNQTDARSDLYSFGVTLFEMLTGQKPFSGDEHEECFQQHQTTTPPEPRSINPEVSPRLSNLVLKCLSKSAADRPSNFSVVELELSTILLEGCGGDVPAVVPEPLTSRDLINRAASLIVLADYEQALLCLDDEALKSEPNLALAMTLRGKALASMGMRDEALSYFKHAVASDPLWPFAWSEASRVFVESGNYETAVIYIDQAIALHRNSPSFWNDRGVIFMREKQLQSASKCLQHAIELDAYFAPAHLNLGNLHFEQDQVAEAIQCFKSAVRLGVGSRDPRYRLAKAYTSLGLHRETIEVCREALYLWPKSDEFLDILHLAYRGLYHTRVPAQETEFSNSPVDFLVQSQDAESILSRCITLLAMMDHDPVVFYLCAADLHRAAKDPGSSQRIEFLAMLEKVEHRTVTDGADKRTFYWLGKLYHRLKCYAECMATFRRCVELFGPHDDAYYYLAACYEEKGDFEQAARNYEEVLVLDPECRSTRNALRRLKARIAEAAPAPTEMAEFAYQS